MAKIEAVKVRGKQAVTSQWSTTQSRSNTAGFIWYSMVQRQTATEVLVCLQLMSVRGHTEGALMIGVLV